MKTKQFRNLVMALLLVGGIQLSYGMAQPVSVHAAPRTTTVILPPIAYITKTGSSDKQPISNLAILDQTGKNDNPPKYKQFNTPGLSKYDGYQTFRLPNANSQASITAINLTVNFKGPLTNRQVWTWSIFDWNSLKWVVLGRSTPAKEWTWTVQTFRASGTLNRYVNTQTRQIRIRLQSNNATDNAKIDYQAISVTYSLPIASTPTPTSIPPTSIPPTASPVVTSTPVPSASGIHVMRVEYTDYVNSRPEVSWWEQQMKASGINMVALAAGRVEWAYFKWTGYEANWSGAVEDTGIDFLAEDSRIYGQWADVNAVIDVYAPNYVSAHPDKAAINVLGQRSPNLVSTAEMTQGAFSRMLLDMVGFIAANYPNVDSISITELSYRLDGYGPDDLALYSAATGRTDWPRQSNGQVDIDDPSIGNWRSAVLGEFLGRATAIAHQYGKQLFMDVGVSYGNLSLMTNNKGTNYNVMLQNVDKIVVWDYFGEEGFPPEYSRDIAAYLTQFGNDRVILSIGLWGASGTTVTASDFETAIQSAQAGGMPTLWICPGSMLGPDHWQILEALWGSQ